MAGTEASEGESRRKERVTDVLAFTRLSGVAKEATFINDDTFAQSSAISDDNDSTIAKNGKKYYDYINNNHLDNNNG